MWRRERLRSQLRPDLAAPLVAACTQKALGPSLPCGCDDGQRRTVRADGGGRAAHRSTLRRHLGYRDDRVRRRGSNLWARAKRLALEAATTSQSRRGASRGKRPLDGGMTVQSPSVCPLDRCVAVATRWSPTRLPAGSSFGSRLRGRPGGHWYPERPMLSAEGHC